MNILQKKQFMWPWIALKGNSAGDTSDSWHFQGNMKEAFLEGGWHSECARQPKHWNQMSVNNILLKSNSQALFMSQGDNGGKSVLYEVQKPCYIIIIIIIIITLNKPQRIIFCESLKENHIAAAIFSHSPGLNWFVPVIINYEILTALGWAAVKERPGKFT